MIQDIKPHVFINEYIDCKPSARDKAIIINNDEILLHYDTINELICLPDTSLIDSEKSVYLFSIDDNRYFLYSESLQIEGFEFIQINKIRTFNLKSNEMIFAIYSAYHLSSWYSNNVYCGKCAHKTIHEKNIRALRCPECDNLIFPRINPAVIVGVINGDKLLLTRYKTNYNHNALVAGFTEFGETLEQTVIREVKEEVGLNIKNIRYYKSQPWGIASDVLMGFFCEVDGDDTIVIDENELKYANFVNREDIALQDKEYSLTNEMMKRFKERNMDF